LQKEKEKKREKKEKRKERRKKKKKEKKKNLPWYQNAWFAGNLQVAKVFRAHYVL
jgi:CRISPR/Cas system-associated endoribonuclease Cas2